MGREPRSWLWNKGQWMSKEIVISCTPEEVVAGIIQDGEVVEIFVEREKHRSPAGNVYKGRVQRVLPGMQAAFVDIGLERDGFLSVSEVIDEIEDVEIEGPSPGAHAASIEEMLKPGQPVLVQIAKAPMGAKGARLTSHITLPGRYLVYMPTVTHVGVSRKIESAAERARLRGIVKQNRQAYPGGYITRTAAEGKLEEELVADMRFLHGAWQNVKRKEEKMPVPSCVHRDLGLAQKLMRDVARSDVSAIRIDDEEEYIRCVELLETTNPEMVRRLRLHSRERDMLRDYGITQEIEKSLSSRVWLKSGGYIVINQTEALVAIDVNTGRFTGKKDFEETIVQTNVEAAKEVARQIRLRNLGGILVLDFIDMESRKSRQRVTQALEAELKKDRSPSVVLPINDFGLALITRKRVQASLEKSLCEPCTACSGSGLIKSAETVAYAAAREVRRLREHIHGREVVVRFHPDVARTIRTNEREMLKNLERDLRKRVSVREDSSLRRDRYVVGAPGGTLPVGPPVTAEEEAESLSVPGAVGDSAGHRAEA